MQYQTIQENTQTPEKASAESLLLVLLLAPRVSGQRGSTREMDTLLTNPT